MVDPYTPAELEVGAEALYDSAKGRIRPWVQYSDLTPEGAVFYRDKAKVVLSAVVPPITARVREQAAEEIAGAIEAICECAGEIDPQIVAECEYRRSAAIARAHRTTPPTGQEVDRG